MVSGLSTSYAQTRETDRQVAENFRKLWAWVDTLEGRQTADERDKQKELDEQRALVKLIAEASVRNPSLLDVAKPLTEMLRSGRAGNQRAEFFRLIVLLSCANSDDNCELKRRVEDHERRLREMENKGLQPTPTPAPEVEPPRHSPRRHTPERQPLPEYPIQPVWTGRIDLITDNRDAICPNASLIARCQNCSFGDGWIHHGDIFLNCRGEFVLLRHIPTYPTYVAVR
jgi:hypothetical protein